MIRIHVQKILIALLIASFLLIVLPVNIIPVKAVSDEFAGGSGTAADPYLIGTKEHLNNVRNHLDAHYKLIANIAFTEKDFTTAGAFYNAGYGFIPIGTIDSAFCGFFDGDGHSISNFYSHNPSTSKDAYVGLFSVNNGTIKNLGMVDADISVILNSNLYAYCGGIVGKNLGTIVNCYNVGSITSRRYAGGIAGYNAGTIASCHNRGKITASTTGIEPCAGGIVGYNDNGTLSCCYNTGIASSEITISSSFSVMYASFAGGIVGYGYSGTVEKCYNIGPINANANVTITGNTNANAAANAGGIIGSSNCRISQCYNTGEISANAIADGYWYDHAWAYSGGIVGSNNSQTTNCYNIGALKATSSTDQSYSGGIAGNNSGTIKNCYFHSETTTSGCKLVSMYSDLTYQGFDFENIWKMGDNSYPFPIFRSVKNLAVFNNSLNENTTDFAGGKGIKSDPFVITTPIHLSNIKKYNSSYYVINNDIIFDPENAAFPTGWKPFAFKGYLDGQGYKITGIRITVSNTLEYQWHDPGLFSSNSGTIENLTVDDMRISVSSMGGKYGGFICAVNTGEIINCHSANCTIVLQNTSHFFGGIAGNNSGSIHNCTSNNSINWGANGGRIGGITANNTGSINYCTNNGTITNFGAYTPISGGISALNSGNIISSNNLSPIITKSTYSQTGGYSGGIVGQMTKGTISQCYNLEAITAETTEYKASAYSGGIVAYISGGNILDCYNTGDIYGETDSYSTSCYIGGIIGYNNSIGTLKNCYSVGATSGRAASSNLYVGYICGYNASNTIENFYYLGIKDNGAGYGDSSAMQGLNASQMKNPESFSGYDFQLIWEFREKNAYGYPTLINNEHFEFDYSLSFAECKNGEIIGTSDNIQQSSDQNIYFKLLKDAEINLSLTNDLYIDLNGYTLAGTITTNSYTLYGMDSTTDNYTCENNGYFNCVDENGNAIIPVAHFKSDITGSTKRYMAIKDENGYSFHRFYLSITNVSLAPNVTGFGYKAEFYGDEMVQQQIASVGYNLWLTEDHIVSRTTAFKNTLTLRLQNFKIENYGETPVNANVCIVLTDGTIIESSVTSMSMRTMLENINAQYDKYSDVQLSAVKTMIEKHAIIKSWDTENLFA